MIFGFNTDIKVDETVYHVQSEAREAEKLLQTQVFVKGHCIGKRAVSYASDEANGQTEETRHDLLRDQHRNVVKAVRERYLDQVIESSSSKTAASATQAAVPVVAAPTQQPAPTPTPNPALDLKFLGSSRPTHEALVIRFSVASADSAVEGATIVAQILPDAKAAETFSGGSAMQGTSDREGIVELSLPIPANAQGEASLVVQANHAGLTVAKKFRIKTKE